MAFATRQTPAAWESSSIDAFRCFRQSRIASIATSSPLLFRYLSSFAQGSPQEDVPSPRYVPRPRATSAILSPGCQARPPLAAITFAASIRRTTRDSAGHETTRARPPGLDHLRRPPSPGGSIRGEHGSCRADGPLATSPIPNPSPASHPSSAAHLRTRPRPSTRTAGEVVDV